MHCMHARSFIAAETWKGLSKWNVNVNRTLFCSVERVRSVTPTVEDGGAEFGVLVMRGRRRRVNEVEGNAVIVWLDSFL